MWLLLLFVSLQLLISYDQYVHMYKHIAKLIIPKIISSKCTLNQIRKSKPDGALAVQRATLQQHLQDIQPRFPAEQALKLPVRSVPAGMGHILIPVNVVISQKK